MYSSSQPRSPHWYQYMAPLWLTMGSLSMGGDQEVLDGAATFEVGLNAISTTDLFDTFTKTLCGGYDNVTLSLNSISGSLGISSPLVVGPINDLTGRPIESSVHLSKAHLGYLPLVRAFLWWSLSYWSNSGLLHTVLAICERVWITLNLAER